MSRIDRKPTSLQRVSTDAQRTVDKARNAVSQATDSARRTVGQFSDGFESQATNKARGLLGLFGRGSKPDKVYDGHFVGAGGKTFPPGTPLSQIPGVTPRNNPNPTETFLFVNGIGTTKDSQFHNLQQIADATGGKVVGLHNSTEGMLSDLVQCVKDKLDKGRNPAVDSLADTVYSELKAGRSVHLMGHSQGGLITSRALKDVSRRLRLEDGLSRAETEKLLSKVNVETFGAAAGSYPDGPKYVHYVNNKDLVPTLFGLGNGKGLDEFLRNAGKGAVVHRFEYGSGITGTHELNKAYLSHRVPFEQARQGQFE